ncbi:uncharacterized protein LOC143286583 [Babylonia areolata]|uniref:uncharacterized protein LOC143286583 n=1 Tax=Babylonia areolata TaxID=304850 RepID=UPI003FD075B3
MSAPILSRWLLVCFLLSCIWSVTARPNYQMPLRHLTTRQGCGMFPCAYSHLAKMVGRISMLRSIMRIMSDCAHDEQCSPGKRRRKRSVPRLLSILKRQSNLP